MTLKESTEKLKRDVKGIRENLLSMAQDFSESFPRPVKDRFLGQAQTRKGGILSMLQERPLMKSLRERLEKRR